MGRPRGSGKNTAMVNGRVTAEQMEWLLERAEELGGNLSAALRQTITDARLLEHARTDYKHFRSEHPDFKVPFNEDDGTSRVFEVVLLANFQDSEDLDLRSEEEAAG
jgi:hypothetical protein